MKLKVQSSKQQSKEIAESNYDWYLDKNKHRFMICQNSESDSKYWKGAYCDRYTKVGNNTVSVLCWKCTDSLILSMPETKKESKGYPRGWKFFSVFVDNDGNVFHKGIEQPALKGTLPVTVIQEKDKPAKLTKKEKEEKTTEVSKQIVTLKSNLLKETSKMKRKSISREINKANKLLKKLS